MDLLSYIQCVASGICGGGLPGLGLPPPPGGCFNPIPPVAPSCMGGLGGLGLGGMGGCGAGYSCGQLSTPVPSLSMVI